VPVYRYGKVQARQGFPALFRANVPVREELPGHSLPAIPVKKGQNDAEIPAASGFEASGRYRSCRFSRGGTLGWRGLCLEVVERDRAAR